MLLHRLLTQTVATALLTCAAVSTAQSATWRYSLGFPTGVPIQTAKTYAQTIKESTENRYSIRIYEMSLLS